MCSSIVAGVAVVAVVVARIAFGIVPVVLIVVGCAGGYRRYG